MLRIPSIDDPNNRVYAISTGLNGFDYGSRKLSELVGFYETLGDGDTQHTPLVQCCDIHFIDFCASTAKWVLEGPPSRFDEAGGVIDSMCKSYNVTHAKVAGAGKVKYREGKYQWYEESTFKVSSARSKRHDRRWNEVVEWHDGSFKAICGLLGLFHGTLLLAYSQLDDARSVYYDVFDQCAPSVGSMLDWLGWDWKTENMANGAFHAMREIGAAWRYREASRRSLDGYLSNRKNAMENAE